MKIEEIIYELETIYCHDVTGNEKIALNEAIPILKRCEKYRKALEEIYKLLPLWPDQTESSQSIARIVVKTFDCEES